MLGVIYVASANSHAAPANTHNADDGLENVSNSHTIAKKMGTFCACEKELAILGREPNNLKKDVRSYI